MSEGWRLEAGGWKLRPLGLIIVGIAALWLGVACEEDSGTESTPTSTGTPAAAIATETVPASEATVTATIEASAIREVDFSTVQDVRDFTTENGGEVDPAAILYADLTGDGAEEAIVPVSSGGTLGNLAVFVFSTDIYGAVALLQVEPQGASGITADLQEGQLFTDEASYRANDPECCPSQITRRYYRWDGSALVVDHEEQIIAEPGVR